MSETTKIEPMEMGRIDDPVDASAPAPEADKPVNPRDAMMKAIAEKYDNQIRGGEIAYGEQLLEDARHRAGVDEPAPELKTEGEPEAALADAAPVESTATPAPAVVAPSVAPPAPEQPQLIAVPINGQQLYVTQEQLMQLARMGAVANLALQQAPQAPPPPTAPEPARAAPVASPALSREQAVQLARRLSYGSEDDQASAVQELAAQFAQRPAVDPETIKREAADEAFARMRHEADLGHIGQEFPDVFGNRYRTIAAIGALTDIRQRDAMLGHQRSQLEQYREAASIARAQFASQPPSQSGDPSSPAPQAAPIVADMPQRVERKRAAPRNPVAVSRTAPLGEPEQRAPTASEIVDRYRVQRGQMPMR